MRFTPNSVSMFDTTIDPSNSVPNNNSHAAVTIRIPLAAFRVPPHPAVECDQRPARRCGSCSAAATSSAWSPPLKPTGSARLAALGQAARVLASLGAAQVPGQRPAHRSTRSISWQLLSVITSRPWARSSSPVEHSPSANLKCSQSRVRSEPVSQRASRHLFAFRHGLNNDQPLPWRLSSPRSECRSECLPPTLPPYLPGPTRTGHTCDDSSSTSAGST